MVALPLPNPKKLKFKLSRMIQTKVCICLCQVKQITKNIFLDSLSERELQSICNQLKHNRNWEIVLKQWVDTLKLRREMIDSNNDPGLQQIFLDWPLYKYSKAQELVSNAPVVS